MSVTRKISSGVVHELPADLRKALTSTRKRDQHGRKSRSSDATSGFVGLSQRKKEKREAAGSSGVVQVLRIGNDAPVVGLDAPTANSKLVKLDTATAHANLRLARDTPKGAQLFTARLPDRIDRSSNPDG